MDTTLQESTDQIGNADTQFTSPKDEQNIEFAEHLLRQIDRQNWCVRDRAKVENLLQLCQIAQKRIDAGFPLEDGNRAVEIESWTRVANRATDGVRLLDIDKSPAISGVTCDYLFMAFENERPRREVHGFEYCVVSADQIGLIKKAEQSLLADLLEIPKHEFRLMPPKCTELPTSPAKNARRRRGRPIDTDLERDRIAFEAWNSGMHENHASCAKELGMRPKEFEWALDRHKKRVKRSVKED